MSKKYILLSYFKNKKVENTTVNIDGLFKLVNQSQGNKLCVQPVFNVRWTHTHKNILSDSWHLKLIVSFHLILYPISFTFFFFFKFLPPEVILFQTLSNINLNIDSTSCENLVYFTRLLPFIPLKNTKNKMQFLSSSYQILPLLTLFIFQIIPWSS